MPTPHVDVARATELECRVVGPGEDVTDDSGSRARIGPMLKLTRT